MTALLKQRTQSDCAMASLGILLADLAVRRVDPEYRGAAGLYSDEVIRTAKAAGVTLKARRFRLPLNTAAIECLDSESGILRIRWNGRKMQEAPNGHFCTLIGGTIFCPSEHVAMTWRDYLAQFDARPCHLLKVTA